MILSFLSRYRIQRQIMFGPLLDGTRKWVLETEVAVTEMLTRVKNIIVIVLAMGIEKCVVMDPYNTNTTSARKDKPKMPSMSTTNLRMSNILKVKMYDQKEPWTICSWWRHFKRWRWITLSVHYTCWISRWNYGRNSGQWYAGPNMSDRYSGRNGQLVSKLRKLFFVTTNHKDYFYKFCFYILLEVVWGLVVTIVTLWNR